MQHKKFAEGVTLKKCSIKNMGREKLQYEKVQHGRSTT